MLYEDDYEFEEQPAHIRDRAIPGSGGGGGGRGRRPFRGGGRPRSNGPSGKAQPVPEDAKTAHALLTEMLAKMGVGASDISYIPRQEGEYFEVNGPDLAMLIGRHGNTLEAINLVFNNIINAGNRGNRRYFTIDAEGYRARRAERLKEIALDAVEEVVRSGKPSKLEPMLPSERKIVHMTISEDARIRTESEGVEPERCVVVFPA